MYAWVQKAKSVCIHVWNIEIPFVIGDQWAMINLGKDEKYYHWVAHLYFYYASIEVQFGIFMCKDDNLFVMIRLLSIFTYTLFNCFLWPTLVFKNCILRTLIYHITYVVIYIYLVLWVLFYVFIAYATKKN